jgi:hypothetical protein
MSCSDLLRLGCNEADAVRSARRVSHKGKKVDAKISKDFKNLIFLKMNKVIDFFINNSE